MSGKRGAQRGGALIDALIAMLVLSLGVMGMAATQTRTLITNRPEHQPSPRQTPPWR